MRKTAIRLVGLATIALTFAGILSVVASPVDALPGPVVPRLAGCAGHVVRPAQFDPICNDGNGTVIRLRWSSWGEVATGHGKFYTRQCGKGGCTSAPTVTLYPVDVLAWRVQGGSYSRLQYYFPHRRPSWAPREWVITYSGGSWHGKVF
jgi:hypothetical protein